MISYAKFLTKRVLCRKSNLFLIFVCIGIVFIFLIMNIKSQKEFRNMLEDQIRVENTVPIKQAYESLLEYYNNKDWSMVYHEYSNILQQQKRMIEDSIKFSNDKDTSSKNLFSYIDKQLIYIEYLNEHNLEYEYLDYPIFGLSFTSSISQTILPIMITVCCIYILIQVFTLDYSKNIDISNLFPIGRRKVFLTKIMVGIGVSVLTFFLVLVSSFLLATLFSFNTGLEYPVIMQDTNTETWFAVKAITLFKEWFVIGILFYVSLSLFTYILSLFIKEDGPLLLTELCIILGLAFLPNMIDYFKYTAHLFPTTYMNYVNVVKGNLAVQYHNVKITSCMGFQILSISIVIQFIFCIMKHHLRRF